MTRTEPTARVDVLAVMDAEIRALPEMAALAEGGAVTCDPSEAIRRLSEARAAVAELIEAASELAADRYLSHPINAERMARINAALLAANPTNPANLETAP